MKKISEPIFEFNEELIAPCGINCGLCGSYLALKYEVKKKGIRMPYCPGCRPRDKKCAFLKKRCKLLANDEIRYCYECKDFPCPKLQKIDSRYRERYHMSMIENLKFIKNNGINKFFKKEKEKWKCPECGDIICCHNGLCFNCKINKLKKKKKPYCWEEN